MVTSKSKNKNKVTKTDVKKTNFNTELFNTYLEQESERTGKSPDKIIEETFKDGYLVWSVEESATIGGGITQATPVLTAWAMPTEANDVDEMKRLRKDFAPVARAIDYLRTMIMGNNIDVLIDDPMDKNKLSLKEDLQDFMKLVYQDQYTTSLYTLLSIMLDEALTVGAAGAEIRYNADPYPTFLDYVTSVQKSTLPVAKSSTGGKEYVYFESKEPEWEQFKSIVQLKILKNAVGRLKLYRDPRTWDANYWTLDEIVGSGDTGTPITQMELKKDSGTAIRYHPWQVFWLSVNRREYSEIGVSIIEPVRKTALLLEKILNSVGEGIYRAGNKKYFIVCGTEKRPWSKPHIRNVMQQIQEMGKRNWTNIPVPYGFDIKEIGGQVFEAEAVTTKLLEILAQGMHVPLSIIAESKLSPESSKEQSSASFNEIERMRHEFKQAVEQQLFKKQLWCKHGKTRQKQGGALAPMYVPELEQTTKGLQNPIDRLETIVKLLNVANPVDPQIKLELDRELAKTLGYDMIKMQTQDELRKKMEEQEKMKEEQQKLQLQQTKDNAKMAKEGQTGVNPMAKTQGKPEPPSLSKQEKRLESGVSKRKTASMGGSRIPKDSVGGAPMNKGGKQQVGETEIEETADVLKQEIAQHSQNINPSKEYKEESSQNTSGNFGPTGYYKINIGKGGNKALQIKKSDGEFITSFINPLSQMEVSVVRTQLADGIAGYSKDGTKIYIDEAVPHWMFLGLITHELFEMTLMLTLGLEYEAAHRKATEVEHEAVENLGLDWKEYDQEFRRINKDIVAKRSPHPKNPSDIKEMKGGLDSTRIGHTAQEDLNKSPADKTDVNKLKTQEVHITVETKSQPQEIKVINENKPLEIKVTSEAVVKTPLDEVVAEMTKTKTELAKKEIDLAEQQKQFSIEENGKKKKALESQIKQNEAAMKESESKVTELEARKKAIEEQIKTEQEKQKTEKKKQDIIDGINDKVEGL